MSKKKMMLEKLRRTSGIDQCDQKSLMYSLLAMVFAWVIRSFQEIREEKWGGPFETRSI